jgi:hypothetical protein
MEKIHKGGEVDMKNLSEGIYAHLYDKIGDENEWGPTGVIVDLRFRVTIRVNLQAGVMIIRFNFLYPGKLRRLI